MYCSGWLTGGAQCQWVAGRAGGRERAGSGVTAAGVGAPRDSISLTISRCPVSFQLEQSYGGDIETVVSWRGRRVRSSVGMTRVMTDVNMYTMFTRHASVSSLLSYLQSSVFTSGFYWHGSVEHLQA